MIPHSVLHQSFAEATRKVFTATIASPPWVGWIHPTHQLRYVGGTYAFCAECGGFTFGR